ncbi:TPA: hypothetical protein IRQ32_004600 [Escherichia coli]|nr:hypothetical protein [Escherichia coli]
MKKTLTALAVAASAMASGAAMAGWVPNGLGGELKLSGELTPADHVTPWEVMVGDAVTGLDAPVKKGQKIAEIKVKKSIPVLGIRTQSNEPFKGTSGISPQIDFGGALGEFGENNEGGLAKLTLDVKNPEGNKIGKLVTGLKAAAVYTYDAQNVKQHRPMFASASGKGFYGGLAKSGDKVHLYADSFATNHFPEANINFNKQNKPEAEYKSPDQSTFGYNNAKYSAFYASAIENGRALNIILDNPVSGDDKIQWNASLPVVVSYM